ncbi:DUF6129 family protein [Thiothrix nivea]|uniref:DUF6129 domain-containing protein n=1 Tax=Thiothrix nivea (strain ATCC 35100 / DSM 5205 / JP2) TaxID=870187 RepID=A0A656HJH6_THINJ|nr:DUF6129 family protein [Thiothrix nivea]EIJ36513.1 hypothetical protein Thini_4014 [Thiothrix nivea DSM 5205]
MMTPEQLGGIVACVESNGLADTQLPYLRGGFPDLHFTWCMDDDVCGPQPAAQGKGFNVYLVDSSSHCLCFTPSLEAASGVVIAELGEDDA